MIGRLTGILLEKNPPQITVDVHGLGYEIDVPMSTFYNLPASGEKVTLHTHLAIREDAHLLFGFLTESERAAFRQLLKISGVGARTALALLSGLSVAELAQAVVLQEAGRLVKIPGIGKKTAERLLLVLGELTRGTKNFDLLQKTLGIDNDTLNSVLEDLEKKGLMRVEQKQGLLGPKVELYPTEEGLKKFYS
jgi:Holliday junction DNA helicase RuvA subunit